MEFPRPETGPPGYNAARLLTQMPPPRRYLLFYYGHYSNVARGRRGKTQPQSVSQVTTPSGPEDQTTLSPARKAGLRRRWADLIRRVAEVDPLVCDHCGG